MYWGDKLELTMILPLTRYQNDPGLEIEREVNMIQDGGQNGGQNGRKNYPDQKGEIIPRNSGSSKQKRTHEAANIPK